MRRLKDGGRRRQTQQRSASGIASLVSWLDKAAARGALHRNTAARRKAQAERLVASGKSPSLA